MPTSTGCLTLTAMVVLSAGFADDAWGQICPFSEHTPETNYTDDLSSYTSDCTAFPGHEYVCAKSISHAITCAGKYFSDTHLIPGTTYVYSIQVGEGTPTNKLVVDLTQDTSLHGTPLRAPAFPISDINPAPFDSTTGTGQCGTTSCLVIEGYVSPGSSTNASANTTLITPAGFAAFNGSNVSHLVIRHLTMMQQADAMVQGTAVCPSGSPCQGSVSLTATVAGAPVTKTFPTLEVSVNQPINVIEDPVAFASVAIRVPSTPAAAGR